MIYQYRNVRPVFTHKKNILGLYDRKKKEKDFSVLPYKFVSEKGAIVYHSQVTAFKSNRIIPYM